MVTKVGGHIMYYLDIIVDCTMYTVHCTVQYSTVLYSVQCTLGEPVLATFLVPFI